MCSACRHRPYPDVALRSLSSQAVNVAIVPGILVGGESLLDLYSDYAYAARYVHRLMHVEMIPHQFRHRIPIESFSADIIANVLEAWNRTGRSVRPSPNEATSHVHGNGKSGNALHTILHSFV
jgi:hypothetical protein